MIIKATKNIVPIDSVDFSANVVVRSRHENERPSPPVHPTPIVHCGTPWRIVNYYLNTDI